MESFLLITNQRSILSEILEPYKKGWEIWMKCDYTVKLHSWFDLYFNKIEKCVHSTFIPSCYVAGFCRWNRRDRKRKQDNLFMRWYIQNGKSIMPLKSSRSHNLYINVWYNYCHRNCVRDSLQMLLTSYCETHQIQCSCNIHQNKLLTFMKFWLIVIIKSWI